MIRIRLEKSEAPRNIKSDDPERVVCLGGKRNSPPEDCGGLPGIEEICDSLETPWEGSYDPEDFDMNLINLELQNLDI